MRTIPQFLVAAPSSGAGKTTVARGLMALLRSRGLAVQPFKCGPDYIDTKFHEAVCGRPSVNLDLFMASPSHVREIYARYSAGAGVCVVEGMMGMFDGYDRDLGSAAHMARVLRLPVVLVVDARSAAYSLAPLLYGFTRFGSTVLSAVGGDDADSVARSDVPVETDSLPPVDVAGVIFNKVGSERHREMLRRVCDDLGIECFGFLPKCAAIDHPSRYLGLDFSAAAADDELVGLIDENVDWRRILQLTTPTGVLSGCAATEALLSAGRSMPAHGHVEAPCAGGGQHIAVASSAESFSFIYQEHLDLLRTMGRVTLFSPDADEPLPAGTTLLYLPGGYPERHAAELSRASRTLTSIRGYADGGGRILAECGGMMYLCRSIATDEDLFPMAGVLPYDITARTADRRLSLGYRQFRLGGYKMRGHEFHYSRFAGDPPQSAVPVANALGEPVTTPVICHRNVIAGYTHLYWGEADIMGLFGEVGEW